MSSSPTSLLGFPVTVTTLEEIRKNLGLGATSAYNLAATGLLGEPVAQYGRQKFFDRKRADAVIAERLRARAQNQRTPFVETAAALERR